MNESSCSPRFVSSKPFVVLFLLGMLTGCFIPTASHSQTFDRELGLRTIQLKGFDLLYRTKRAENKYQRLIIGGFSSSGSWDGRDSVNGLRTPNGYDLNLGFRLGYGLSKMGTISESIHWIRGPELSLGFSAYGRSRLRRTSGFPSRRTKRVVDKGFRLRPGFGYMLGLRYSLDEKASISIQAVPRLSSPFSYSDGEGFSEQYRVNFSIARFAIGFNFQLPPSNQEEKEEG